MDGESGCVTHHEVHDEPHNERHDAGCDAMGISLS